MITPHEAFTRIHPNLARSIDGFTVEIQSARYRVAYSNPQEEVTIEFEWIVNPDGLLLYLDSIKVTKGVRLDRKRAYEILAEMGKGLQFLGFRVITEG